MTILQTVLAASLLALLALALYVFALWRHKRAGSGEVDLVGAAGLVETTLAPEGSVLIRGELWPARLCSGARLGRGSAVRVVGASRHLLEVEAARGGFSE
jgi:membrane-bound ClpP family serine protease